MLLGALGASLLGDFWTRKGIMRTGVEINHEEEKSFNARSCFKKFYNSMVIWK